ncbi:Tricorn protease domain-containing protein [Moritella viscosa]|uniref:Lipoprotein n=1 Tax=Moritella viscosa TaxID=80854 RepID=A0A1L0CHA9_9GAMM|nr:Tricorn protease domain-containing protein [Moritella viscosa]SGZ15953.1 Putative uncharacterized protein [Moritella viscosa]SHO10922.1 Putative uncharacterized protein [Moritella viscosa]SHO10936.1 Putative uncharacterized protein [Moritella viscosa]SHO17414.1 Putative uncharacterized protein [Moritella viscosa]SHO17693.1 Putative uncharacterized protein [Moritella viscosa]
MKRQMLFVCFALLLSACDSSTNTVKVEKTPVELKNEQQWEDDRTYITEHNYVRYEDNNGRPRHFIFKAKEWPREDLTDSASYDLPRVMFRWNNVRWTHETTEDEKYETQDKVWSIKTDGTDLRLVTDDFWGAVRVMRRSPDNRYLAFAYANTNGVFKALFDLKTQKTIILGDQFSQSKFLWAEDSSYFYYADGRQHWKYDIATQTASKVDVMMSNESVIYQGKRYVLNDYGVVVYDEAKNERLYSTGVNPDESRLQDFRFSPLKRSISPTGRYAWGEGSKSRYLIDTHARSFKREDVVEGEIGKYRYFELLGLNAKYARDGAARVLLLTLNADKEIDSYIKWGQIGTGQSATESSLYNAFANEGRFIKETGNE